MAIRDLVTEGFGNGTFNGTIPLAVTHGYTIGIVTGPGGTGELTPQRNILLTDSDLVYARAAYTDIEMDLEYLRGTQDGTLP